MKRISRLAFFAACLTQAAFGSKPFLADVDGDGKADLILYDPSGNWYVYQSSGGFVTKQLGGAQGDQALVGDVLGTGRAQLIIYRRSGWFFVLGMDGTYREKQLGGAPDDQPLVGDVLGMGRAQLILYRPSGWFFVLGMDGTYREKQLGGAPGDQALVGDALGTGRAQLILYRPSGWFFVLGMDGTYREKQLGGAPGDIPLLGDRDGDKVDDIALYRSGWFLILQSSGTPNNPGSLPGYVEIYFDVPGIRILSAPSCGQDSVPLVGVAFGDNVAVACYINVAGGWWTKPYFSAPVTTVDPITRQWSSAVNTGGSDGSAQELRAYLIPASYSPPLVGGGQLPPELNQFKYSADSRQCSTQ